MCVPRPWQLSWSLEIPADISEESLPCSRAEQVHAQFCPSTKFRLEFFLASIKTYYPLGLLLTRLPHQSVFPSWINNLSIDFRISWYLGSTAWLAPGSSGSAAVGIPIAALQVLSLGCHFHPQQQDLVSVSPTPPEMGLQLREQPGLAVSK